MPVLSIGGKDVVETGVFVLEHGSNAAILSLDGSPFEVMFDPTLATNEAVGEQAGSGIRLRIAPHGMGSSTMHVANMNIGGKPHKAVFFIDVVDDGARKNHRVAYTLTKAY